MLPTLTAHTLTLDTEVAYRRELLLADATRRSLRRALARAARVVPAQRSARSGPAGPTRRLGDEHSLAA